MGCINIVLFRFLSLIMFLQIEGGCPGITLDDTSPDQLPLIRKPGPGSPHAVRMSVVARVKLSSDTWVLRAERGLWGRVGQRPRSAQEGNENFLIASHKVPRLRVPQPPRLLGPWLESSEERWCHPWMRQPAMSQRRENQARMQLVSLRSARAPTRQGACLSCAETPPRPWHELAGVFTGPAHTPC